MAKTTNRKQNSTSYDAKDIQVLEGLDAIRKRPGMYIGGTGLKSLHHMVYEIVDNSVDEALSGFCNKISVTINEDNSVTIEDNGRGIPTGIHPKYKKSALEIICTVIHSGGKFGGSGYKVSGGLHGVGLSVVNALSEWVDFIVKREGHIWQLKLVGGKPVESTKIIGDTDETGTKITFKPDETIFESVIFNAETLTDRIKEIAFLNQGITMEFCDKRDKNADKEIFYYEGGIVQYIEEINKTFDPLHKDIIYFKNEKDGFLLECALQYTSEYNEYIYSFVNNIKTSDGGTHEQGFKYALSRVVNEVSRQKGILKDKDTNLSGDDVREGLTAIINIKMLEPQFEGQTKGKLTNSEAKTLVDNITYESLYSYFMKNSSILNTIIKKAQEASKAREAAQKARQLTKKKNTIELEGLSSKFANCTSKDPKKCEMYIVEGDSAGGSAKQGRNRYFQAILPLRGKVINCEKSRLTKILSNNEIKTMITAIGAGIGKDFDIEKVKFNKIIIMTDADVDGAHITTLLLTFFYRFMKPLIDAGYVYCAKPPLYKIEKGKQLYYVYSDKEKDKLLEKLGDNITIQRYKGLGEMNADQLWETTMDPKNRVLIRVTETDAVVSNKVFSVLMGNKVDLRKLFIEKHAKYAQIDTNSL